MRLMIMTLLLAVFAVSCNQGTAPGTETSEKTPEANTENNAKGEEPAAKTEGSEEAPETEETSSSVVFENKLAKDSYVIGTSIGQNFAQTGIDVDLDMVLQGMADGIAGKLALNEEEIKQVMTELQEDMMKKQQEKQAKQGNENKGIGDQFLADNKGKEGVVTLPSGLQYKIITAGSGEKPKATDKVKVHYRGTLINGNEFDSSYKRNKPAEFPLNGVIRGWTEGLQLMKPGGKWMFYIPPELGYGPRAQRNIPANSLLIFEVELLEIL